MFNDKLNAIKTELAAHNITQAYILGYELLNENGARFGFTVGDLKQMLADEQALGCFPAVYMPARFALYEQMISESKYFLGAEQHQAFVSLFAH